MKGDKLFKVGIVTAIGGLIGILIGVVMSLMYPVIGAWIALVCSITVCGSLILLLIALFVYAME